MPSRSACLLKLSVRLGARGGVSYKEKNWEKTLLAEVAKACEVYGICGNMAYAVAS